MMKGKPQFAMSQFLRRESKAICADQEGHVDPEEYKQYLLQTRGEYEDLMKEFEFRCRRSASMNYYEATCYEKSVFRLEIVAAILGAFSATSLGVWLLQRQPDINDMSFKSFGQLGVLGMVGLGAAFVVQLLGKGSTRVLPSFTKRAHSHIACGSAWQKLGHKTRSFRIQLDNPKLDVSNYAEWYEQLITESEKLSVMAILSHSTLTKFNDPEEVFKSMKLRRHMFLGYIRLEEMDSSDFLKEHVKT